ncbi:MAG: hypothetical protein HQL82_05365 [Magnetococcales bacterium]|nr:hypothetical protein [Magnetococcales bacterium]
MTADPPPVNLEVRHGPDGAVFLFDPQRSLLIEATSLQQAYDRYRQERLALDDRLARAGLLPSQTAAPRARHRPWLLFLAKVLIAGLLLEAVVFSAVGSALFLSLSAVRNSVIATATETRYALKACSNSVLDGLDRMTPADQQTALQRWRTFLDALEPYLEAAGAALRHPVAPQDGTTPPESGG